MESSTPSEAPAQSASSPSIAASTLNTGERDPKHSHTSKVDVVPFEEFKSGWKSVEGRLVKGNVGTEDEVIDSANT
jgi:hypothetical protein